MVSVSRAELPLDQLCGFASRRSTRRGFVFVSKVLGKHWPVRPSVFADCCQRLVARMPTFQGPVVIVGMAETATGLGQASLKRCWNRRPRRPGMPRRRLVRKPSSSRGLDIV